MEGDKARLQVPIAGRKVEQVLNSLRADKVTLLLLSRDSGGARQRGKIGQGRCEYGSPRTFIPGLAQPGECPL
ncbi:hypothetical protein KM043_013743 [Ampulex compressa]|nr:hypothetical protein KM043_013743 [Ampulex compressa]